MNYHKFAGQLSGLLASYDKIAGEYCRDATPVFVRCFVSDAANQEALTAAELRAHFNGCVVSVVEQAPLNGTKIAMWICLQTGVATLPVGNNIVEVRHNGYRHIWSSMAAAGTGTPHAQTKRVFEDYIGELSVLNCGFADGCMRTWLFVSDIDRNYAAVVEARNEIFDSRNLTKDTHFIASTGICGRKASPGIALQMDAYAVAGLMPEQVRYLNASTHLNPTHEYGVRFERGTCICYGDRRQVLISGTASIDNAGRIVWPGDICRQTRRMWENVEALLHEAGCTFADMAYIIVYLRDPSDYTVVYRMFDEKFPDVPKVIVLAPVCRPGWLVEMECAAIRQDANAAYPLF